MEPLCVNTNTNTNSYSTIEIFFKQNKNLKTSMKIMFKKIERNCAKESFEKKLLLNENILT